MYRICGSDLGSLLGLLALLGMIFLGLRMLWPLVRDFDLIKAEGDYSPLIVFSPIYGSLILILVSVFAGVAQAIRDQGKRES